MKNIMSRLLFNTYLPYQKTINDEFLYRLCVFAGFSHKITGWHYLTCFRNTFSYSGSSRKQRATISTIKIRFFIWIFKVKSSSELWILMLKLSKNVYFCSKWHRTFFVLLMILHQALKTLSIYWYCLYFVSESKTFLLSTYIYIYLCFLLITH